MDLNQLKVIWYDFIDIRKRNEPSIFLGKKTEGMSLLEEKIGRNTYDGVLVKWYDFINIRKQNYYFFDKIRKQNKPHIFCGDKCVTETETKTVKHMPNKKRQK